MLNENNLQESAKAAHQFASKLKNMREHLKALIDKKIRLEVEIRQLSSSIKEKQKNYSRETKIKLQLEGDETLIDQLKLAGLLTEEYKRELLALREFDSELKATSYFLEDNFFHI